MRCHAYTIAAAVVVVVVVALVATLSLALGTQPHPHRPPISCGFEHIPRLLHQTWESWDAPSDMGVVGYGAVQRSR